VLSVSSIGVCGIEAVDYVQVDVVGPEPTQARLAGSQDVPS
jgi:hypothetical protein